MTLRQRLARRLRFLADRIDDAGAPHAIGWSFTHERNVGIRFRNDGRGCPLWYLGEADYERAHTEADTEHYQVDWATMTARRVGGEQPWGIHGCRIDGHQGCTPYECRWAPAEPSEEPR
ncbi:hypothetical protein [Micromonospora sp. RV43]|uniref:hypothetical protein n=1 Tax=Micromonospora sp. RV43 TaxID=1661387 RepID=UPI00064B8566|nr:hypothetical protein [Micromonospora sp. RV43]